MLEKTVKQVELLPSPWEEGKEKVILIHGLFLHGFIMKPIARYLIEKGYSPLLYDYPTMRHTVEDHGEMLADFLKRYFREGEENGYTGKIHFVTHSMGGIILRKALSLLSPADRAKAGHIVMVAPPNKGSDVAKHSLQFLPFPAKYIKPLEGLSSGEDSYANKGVMPEEFRERLGIIGAESDLLVKREYTKLTVCKERIFLPGHHTPILFKKATFQAILSFLQKGSFPEGLERV